MTMLFIETSAKLALIVSFSLFVTLGSVASEAQANDILSSASDINVVTQLGSAVAGISILAKGPVWVRIEDRRGNMLVAETFHAGDRYNIPARYDLLINARDGGQLVYLVDGRERGKLGNDGEILLSRPLILDATLPHSDQP